MVAGGGEPTGAPTGAAAPVVPRVEVGRAETMAATEGATAVAGVAVRAEAVQAARGGGAATTAASQAVKGRKVGKVATRGG